MAEKEATLIIRLKDMASGGVDKFKSTLGDLKGAYVAVTAAVGAAIAVGVSALKAYAEQEAAVSKLENALRNQGLEVQNTSAALVAYAGELQKTTTFSDDAIIETQALLTTFGLAGKEMQDATMAALNLATGLGIDLKSATMLLGKAAVGETATLKRYGVTIQEGIPVAQQFAAVLDAVNQRFSGSAQAAAGTMAGRVEVLKNRIGELKESLGAMLLPVFEFLISVTQRVVSNLEVLSGWFLNGRVGLMEFAMAVLEFSKTIVGAFLLGFEPVFFILEKFGLDMETVTLRVNAAIDRQIAKIQQKVFAHTQSVNKGISEEQRGLAATVQTTNQRQAFIDQSMKAEAEKKDKFYAEMLERLHKQADAETEARIKQAEMEAKVNESRAQNFHSTLNFISTLSQAKNKELAAVGKAAAIATATMDTYAAANKALASAPPPWNFALAGAVVTAGIANVARISGVKLAEGGIVMPRPGGTQAVIGEAGSPEAVIPLDDERAQGMLGGGGPEIHIHAGTIVADRVSVREFAMMIDRELYSLERNRLSVRT